MSRIDRQRIAAVRIMESLGYSFDGFEWKGPVAATTPAYEEADAMQALLIQRVNKLAGCAEGSDEEMEFKKIAETISAYEAKRWPNGCVPGGKG
jgi:hypothetical protein